jgi:hypothetical protein
MQLAVDARALLPVLLMPVLLMPVLLMLAAVIAALCGAFPLQG